MAFKLTRSNAIGTIWQSRTGIYMITGPIIDANIFHTLNLTTGFLHHTMDTSFETLQGAIESLKMKYLGRLEELDIPSFVQEKCSNEIN
jgi:hypothetical protein